MRIFFRKAAAFLDPQIGRFFTRRSNILHASVLAAMTVVIPSTSEAQQRIPLTLAPVDQGIKIEQSNGGQVLRLSPSGGMLPVAYRATASISTNPDRWSPIVAKADPDYVDQGSLTITNPTGQKFYAAAYPNFSKINGFVRIPTNTTPEQLTNLLVVLHPLMTVLDAGLVFEQEVGPMCDKYGLVSYFPSALKEPGDGTAWNGYDGPQASDFHGVLDGIKACRAQIPTITEVNLAAYSLGGATAVGLAQLWPGMFRKLLIVAGQDNPKVQDYLLKANGGIPVHFERPIQVVGLVSRNDEHGMRQTTAKVCDWFAAANGFTGASTTNSVKLDCYDMVAGADTVVTRMGSNVALLYSDTKNHYDSTFVGTNGFQYLLGEFIKNGKMPGE